MIRQKNNAHSLDSVYKGASTFVDHNESVTDNCTFSSILSASNNRVIASTVEIDRETQYCTYCSFNK